jgi:GNAT superfamily N-acetyltransferase
MRIKHLQQDRLGHCYPPPIILPIEKEDAHPISVFAFAATSSGPLQAYFNPSPADKEKAIKSLERVIQETLCNPAFMPMKAVDPRTGEIASYAVWERVSCSSSVQSREGPGAEGNRWRGGTSFHLLTLMPEKQEEEGRSIGAYVGAEKAKFMESWAKDMNYIELQGLATAPRFQRRGYATALLKLGHDRIDADGQVSFLLGSPVGRYLYASMGWKEIGEIIVDMKDWMEGAERGDLGWGIWKVYHMIRLPKAIC